LARFRQLLDSIENWQPFAFIELYEQCRKRMLPASTERMVRAIQCREFELLLLHCVEGALGERLQPVSRPLDDVGERKARERKRRHAPADEGLRTRNAPPAVTASPATSSTAVAAPPGINVQCPKCRATLFVPATQRGKKTRCGKCSAAFLAPMDKSMTGPVATPPGSVGVRCPQCQHLAMFAPDSRGKSHTCAKCTARFLVPR
jgi:predicted Zn finger-like uncharacterized protein